MFLLYSLPANPDASHTFRYVSPKAVQSVSVAGDFNGWQRDAMPMRVEADGRTWSLKVQVAYGKHQYKFVLNRQTWVLDPTGVSEKDGNGYENSVFSAYPSDYSVPARRGDGVIASSVILHRPSLPDLAREGSTVRFRLRTRPEDIQQVNLALNGRRYPMTEEGRDNVYAYWMVSAPVGRQSVLNYRFELRDGSKHQTYRKGGYGSRVEFSVTPKRVPEMVVPAWPSASVTYQIFPDRFANGDHRNDPKNCLPWGTAPTWSSRYGGDVAGVNQHLPYIKELGARAVYFTPVFLSPSVHRYDAIDYKKVDPEFGTNEEFGRLTQALRRNGIRTVMDFAFNHTSEDYPAFKDVLAHGEASPFKSWYFIHKFPVIPKANPDYDTYGGFGGMPKLNTTNPEVRKMILGVVDYWFDHAALDGIRLDVANEVAPSTWEAFRGHVKPKHPDVWIVGENWVNGQKYLAGDEWDSQMGYEFRDAAIPFFAFGVTKPSEFMGRLFGIYGEYAPQVSKNLMNLLSSHDTPRFLTLCHGNQSLQRLAVTVQLTWPGAPMVYYGEEIGMLGEKDPDNRRTMDWSRANSSNPMLQFYRRLIAFRNHSVALQVGDPEPLLCDDKTGVFGFARVAKGERVYVVGNRSGVSRTVSVPVRGAGSVLVDALTRKRHQVLNGHLKLSLLGLQAVVLHRAR